MKVITCVELVGAVLQAQEVIDHGGLAHTPRPQEQHHGLGGDLSIWGDREKTLKSQIKSYKMQLWTKSFFFFAL